MDTKPTMVGAGADTSEAKLWSRWRGSRDGEARDALLELHLPYARTVAATYYGRRLHDEIEFDEYLQHARLGMLEALERFDPTRGAQFRTFAARRMHGAILDGLERSTEKQQQIAVRQRLRRERAETVKAAAGPTPALDKGGDTPDLFRYLAEVGIGLAICHLLEGTGMVEARDVTEGAAPDHAYRPVELTQLRRRMLQIVDRLPPQQRTVIRYHYLQEHSFEEVASLMGVTRGRISQIHRQALASMRDALGSSPACDVSW